VRRALHLLGDLEGDHPLGGGGPRALQKVLAAEEVAEVPATMLLLHHVTPRTASPDAVEPS